MSVEEVCRKYNTDIVQVSTLFQIKIILLHFLIFLSGVQVGVCCTTAILPLFPFLFFHLYSIFPPLTLHHSIVFSPLLL